MINTMKNKLKYTLTHKNTVLDLGSTSDVESIVEGYDYQTSSDVGSIVDGCSIYLDVEGESATISC